jgi:hypothetical protein
MSSCLNALAAVCWEDMLKPLIGEKVSESTKTWITRLLGLNVISLLQVNENIDNAWEISLWIRLFIY